MKKSFSILTITGIWIVIIATQILLSYIKLPEVLLFVTAVLLVMVGVDITKFIWKKIKTK